MIEAERNYEIYDKELLAIIRALEEWRHYLEGSPHDIEIWTDHKNLEYFREAHKLNRRQARWALYLTRFHFKLYHKPGTSMIVPDTLSRNPSFDLGGADNENQILLPDKLFVRSMENEDRISDLTEQLRNKQADDEVLKAITLADLFKQVIVADGGGSVPVGHRFGPGVYMPKDLLARSPRYS